MKPVSITGARLHNLKNIDVSLPTDKLVVVTGVSGSGKSTLVFDLLFEEGRKRYLQAIGVLSDLGEDRRYEQLTGLRPTVAIKQGVIRQSNPRSVVGSKTRILHYLGMLFAYNYNRNTGVEESLQAAHFSFNSPLGMCEHCRGRGYVFSFNFAVLLPDEKTTLPQMYCNAKMESSFRKFTARLIDRFDLDLNTPFLQLPQVVQDIVLYGRDPEGAQLSGLDVNLQSRLSRGKDIGNAMSAHTCEVCGGSRLGAHARGIDLAGKSFGELASCTIAELNEFLQSLAFEPPAPAANSVVVPATLLAKTRELVSQLVSVKLDYLSLYRPIPTLSGGELQRLFLMSYLDSELESLLYIFDEPTAGLHEIEKKELLQRIISLKAQGNAVIVVEHDKTVISLAEHIVDIGPGAGENGGTVVYQGEYAGLLDSQASATGRYLAQAAASVAVADNSQPKSNFSSADQQITLIDVRTNNLQSVSVSFPLGKLVGVAGVSGSGKSSLISGTLVPALRSEAEPHALSSADTDEAELLLSRPVPLFAELVGAENIGRCVEVGQEPIGRKSGSNPATYLGVWDRIRALFAQESLSIERGYAAGHFSFNAEGACTQCKGNGVHHIWLGTTRVTHTCDICKGLRYSAEILDVQYRGHTISEVLGLSVDHALSLFQDHTSIVRMLEVLVSTGMSYLELGQPATALSGGEAQRLKLAREIGRRPSKQQTLYVLDEPTTGLSGPDCEQLLALCRGLVDRGDTVLMIEHDPIMLSSCDWLLELGPGAGIAGGHLIAEGTPVELKQNSASMIGPFLSVQ